MRNRPLLLALSVALVLAPAPADRIIKLSRDLAVVVPTNSPVTYRSFNAAADNSATFTGAFVMAGAYHVAGGPGTDYSSPWFQPDHAVVALLPYWRGFEAKPTEILFENPDAFVKAVLAPKDRARLNRGKPRSYSGRIAIKVDRFATNLACGNPYYTVRFLSVETPRQLLARRNGVDDNGC